MAILGVETGIALPAINISGWLSNTWFYIFIIGFLGFVLITILILVLFFSTYNKKVIFFENISGKGWQPVMRKRARTIQVGTGGEEILRLLFGGNMSAYGRKMGKNTYWYAKGEDGYWYNFLLGDLDAKMNLMDIEPIDKDVRMFHVAKSRLIQSDYGQIKPWERFAPHIILFIMVIVMLIGLYVIVGKFNEGMNVYVKTAEIHQELAETNKNLLQAQENIQRGTGSGIIQVDTGGGG